MKNEPVTTPAAGTGGAAEPMTAIGYLTRHHELTETAIGLAKQRLMLSQPESARRALEDCADQIRDAWRARLATMDAEAKAAASTLDAAPALPAGGAGLPTVEEMVARLQKIVAGEGGWTSPQWAHERIGYILTGLPLGPDRDAALARLAERRPAPNTENLSGTPSGTISDAPGQEFSDGRVGAGAVMSAARIILDHAGELRPGASTSIPDTMLATLGAEVERLRTLVDRLRADLKLAAEYAGATICEGCGAAIFDCEDGKHTGDVHGCIPFVHDGMPGECWRYRTSEGMDRAWPACALVVPQPSDAENDRLRARLGDAPVDPIPSNAEHDHHG